MLRAAVENNVAWCDHVCRSHGLATAVDPDAWVSLTRSPPLYPDAVTRRPGVDPGRLLSRVDASAGCSIKDSFADLPLHRYGFELLFAAEWLSRPSTVDAAGGLDFRVVEASPDVVRLAAPGATVIGNRSGPVVGLSNLDTTGDPDAAWTGAVRALSAWAPGRPLVGYERGADLAAAHRAGFTSLGPLRVWSLPG